MASAVTKPSNAELAEIRAGVRDGIRGPVMLKWVLEDHDERVRLEHERAKG